MEYKGVKYSVVQLTEGPSWKWEVRFGERKNKSGVTPVSRAAAIKLAEYEIDRALQETGRKATWYRSVSGLISLQQRLAALTGTAASLIAQLRELYQLRERVWKKELTAQDTDGTRGERL